MVDTGSPSAGWAGAATPTPRLDGRTLLVPGPGEGWGVTLYEGAGEAIIWRESPADRSHVAEDERDAGTRGRVRRAVPAAREDGGEPNRERSARRARGRVRRYATANGCTRLATFTYRPDAQGDRPTDRGVVKADWAAFARLVKGRWPELAWVRALECHEDGHLHIHAGLSRYVRKRDLEGLWGHGFVDVRKIRTRRGGREDARAAARYLAKYATKDRETSPGEHGYEVAQGHQPVVVRLRAWNRADGLRAAIEGAGGEVPAYQWDSGSATDWTGPPVAFLGW